MTQIEKTRQIEVPEEHLQKFTNPDQAREYIGKMNLHLSLGENFNKARIKANREMKVEERTKVELSEYLRSLNVDFKKGEKLDFNKALSKMEETKTLNKDEYEMLQELKYAEVSEKLKKLSKLQEIPSLTTETKIAKVKPKRFEPETTQNMINTEDKKTKTSEIYLIPYNEEFKLGDKTIVKIIIKIDENKRDNTANKFRDAVLIKDMENVMGEVLEKPHKIAVYYEDKKGNQIRYEIKSKEITKMYDEQLKKLEGRELLAMSRGVRTE